LQCFQLADFRCNLFIRSLFLGNADAIHVIASMIHREDAITAWNEGLSESLPYKNIEDARRDEEHRKSRNRKEQ